MPDTEAAEIVDFWRDAGPQKWFAKDDAFDRTIRARFLSVHEAAARGALAAWEDAPLSALALVILCDQFPRNIFRGSARAFATDPLALTVADRAIARGFDQSTEEALRLFFYMPFMHSEVLAEQERCVQLFAAFGDAELSKYADEHREVIAKFGRFPHRNRILARATSPAEQAFLDGGGFAG